MISSCQDVMPADPPAVSGIDNTVEDQAAGWQGSGWRGESECSCQTGVNWFGIKLKPWVTFPDMHTGEGGDTRQIAGGFDAFGIICASDVTKATQSCAGEDEAINRQRRDRRSLFTDCFRQPEGDKPASPSSLLPGRKPALLPLLDDRFGTTLTANEKKAALCELVRCRNKRQIGKGHAAFRGKRRR